MTEAEIRSAFVQIGCTDWKRDAGALKMRSRSGKEYWLHSDQLCVIDGDDALLVVYPVSPHPRRRGRRWNWMAPRNMTLVA